MAEMMKERPAYVRFEKRPIEDRDASIAAGHWIGKDIVYALVTPPGTKDVVVVDAEEWIKRLEREELEGRIPSHFVDAYKRAFEKYKKGEEVPINGTAIKGWPPLSPAQQQNCIAMNILTVEDLANLTSEGMARFGMGIVELKRKAANWLEAANSIGGVVGRLTAIETEFKDLKDQNERQRMLIEKLQAENLALKREPAPA
jgi:hypothetical protein